MPALEKLDLYKVHKEEYAASPKPRLVETAPATYLSITGKGAPGGDAFAAKLGALYSMAFTIKMAKKQAGRDYKVCALEALWWGSGERHDFWNLPQETWNWKLLIRTPDFITQDDLKQAMAHLKKKGKDVAASEVKLETLEEGVCAQALHVGPFSAEQKTIQLMLDLALEQGKEPHGLHHEIYLSDPRRVPPEKLRTILRHPVRPRR